MGHKVKSAMFGVACEGSHKWMGLPPNVCKTPAPPAPFVPIPYPIFGDNGTLKAKACANEQIGGKKIQNLDTEVEPLHGNEAGSLFDILTSTNANLPTKRAQAIAGNPMCRASESPMTHTTSPGMANFK